MLSALFNSFYVGVLAGLLCAATVIDGQVCMHTVMFIRARLAWVSQILSYQPHSLLYPVFPASAMYLLKCSKGISYDSTPD